MIPRPGPDTCPGWFIALHWTFALALSVMIRARFLMVAAAETATATGDFATRVLGLTLPLSPSGTLKVTGQRAAA